MESLECFVVLPENTEVLNPMSLNWSDCPLCMTIDLSANASMQKQFGGTITKVSIDNTDAIKAIYGCLSGGTVKEVKIKIIEFIAV